MKEIKLRNNDSGLQVFVNGKFDFNLIPKDIYDLTVAGLELQANEYFKKKRWSTKKVEPP